MSLNWRTCCLRAQTGKLEIFSYQKLHLILISKKKMEFNLLGIFLFKFRKFHFQTCFISFKIITPSNKI